MYRPPAGQVAECWPRLTTLCGSNESRGVCVPESKRRRRQRGGGELESAVMDVLWDHGGWMTPGEVHEAIGDDLAYNTVLTIISRLADKCRLERQRDGRSYAYRPLQTRDEYVAARMSTVFGEAKDRSVAMVGFLETLGDDDRTQLRRMLDGRRRDR